MSPTSEILPASLSAIEDAQLLRRAEDSSGDASYIFKHALVQDTAYASLLKPDRQQLHREVGLALEALFADQKDAFASRLAQHFDAGGEATKAAEYYTLAGDVAGHVYANAEAVTHYTRALALTPKETSHSAQLEHLYSARGRTLELLGRFQDAFDNYTEMSRWALAHNAPTVELKALLALSILYSTFTRLYDPARGLVLAEQASALAHELGDQVAEARALWSLERLATFGNPDHDRAITYGEQGLAIARRMHLDEQAAYILNDLFYPYLQGRTMSQTRSLSNQALEAWQALNNQPMYTDALASSVVLASLEGKPDNAIQASNRAVEINRAIGNLWGQSYGLMYTGYVYWERGDPDKAIRTMLDSIELGVKGGFYAPQVIVRGDLGWIYALLGAPEQGLALARRALATAKHELQYFGQWATVSLVRIQIALGDLAAADASIEADDFIFRDTGPVFTYPHVLGPFMLARAEYAFATSQYGQVIELLQDLIERFRKREVRAYIPEALHLQARAAAALGNLAQARALLETAQADALELDAKWQLWQILTTRAQLEQAQGEPVNAANSYTRARALFDEILSRTPETFRASLLETPFAQALQALSHAIPQDH